MTHNLEQEAHQFRDRDRSDRAGWLRHLEPPSSFLALQRRISVAEAACDIALATPFVHVPRAQRHSLASRLPSQLDDAPHPLSSPPRLHLISPHHHLDASPFVAALQPRLAHPIGDDDCSNPEISRIPRS
ncbi:hypothetical protein BST61_g6239 [Cercospora zeina]